VEKKIVKPKAPRPPADEASIARGQKLFVDQKVQCFNCHGREGRGDGLVSEEDLEKIQDVWGFRDRPADLTIGLFRGGGRPIDLYRRIHDGIKGTPMPAQGQNLNDEQIWDLVNYVRTIPYRDEEPTVAQAGHAGAVAREN
jgi:mono/diheme cytochrome c family protein